LDYAKSNHPEVLQMMIKPIIKLLENSIQDQHTRILFSTVLGRLACTDWFTIKTTLEKYALNDYSASRAICSHILENAIQDERINYEVGKLIIEWSHMPIKGENWKFVWTAASALKQIGQFNIDFALEGIREIISNVVTNTLEIQSNRKVFESVKFALNVLALFGNISPIIEFFCEWTSDSTSPNANKNSQAFKLPISLIIIEMLVLFENIAKKSNTQNEILLSISQNNNNFVSLANLITLSFVTLHEFQDKGEPLSSAYFELSISWIISTEGTSLYNIVIKLIQLMRKNLKSNYPKNEKYFCAYINKFCLQNPRQIKVVKKAAEFILK
jgi:hypothetical protein